MLLHYTQYVCVLVFLYMDDGEDTTLGVKASETVTLSCIVFETNMNADEKGLGGMYCQLCVLLAGCT
jgi:hypothetical protein